MYQNYAFDTINTAIPNLFGLLLNDGKKVPSRNGETLELSFTGITLYDSLAREIIVPGRKHNLAAQIAETMWVLSGRNDIEWLSLYLPRAVDYSDDGKTWRGGYGKRIRNFGVLYNGDGVDQAEHVIDLLRRDPDTRQAVIGIYDPNIDTEPGKDIPCNDFLHFLSREGVLDLHIFVRSNDMMWGWSGINVFEWSALLEVVAGMAGMQPGALHFSVSSFHLYDIHWEKAQQITNSHVDLEGHFTPGPRFNTTGLDDMESFHSLCHQWFIAEESIRKQAQLPTHERNIEEMIDNFPEPMLASWLRVLAWWWTSQPEYLRQLAGTPLFASTLVAMQPLNRMRPALEVVPEPVPTLVERVIALHNEKDAAYGDSWCRRGEMLGILANIARKVDRLGGGETADETSLDTAMDLFVYLAKYRAWISDGGRDVANAVMRTVAENVFDLEYERQYLEEMIKQQFEDLEAAVVKGKEHDRESVIAVMLENTWLLVKELA